MNVFKDLYYVNRKAIKRTTNLFMKNWLIVFTGFVYSTLTLIISIIIGVLFNNMVLGFFAGIVIFLAISAITSNYLYLLFKIVKHDKFTFQDFKDGFTVYLRKIYTVLFIGWVAQLLFGFIVEPILTGLLSGIFTYSVLSVLISILVLILVNALPETIYQKNYSPVESIIYAFNFIKENWIEWFLPNIILMGILYFSTGIIVRNIFAYNIGFNFRPSLIGIAIYFLGQIIFSYTMIYRGVLFDILSTSTRRKRMFMRNLYK